MNKKILLTIPIIVIAIIASLFFYSQNNKETSASVSRVGLIGHWTMDANDISGTTIYDKSGQGKHGTSVSIDNVTGKINQASNYNAITDRIETDTISLPANRSWTGWAKITPGSSGFRRLFQFGSNEFSIYIDSTGNDVVATYNIATCDSNYVPTIGGWHFYGLIFDGSNVNVYVDGVNRKSCPDAGVALSETHLIGNTVSYGQGFNGQIDDVRIYNRALSAQEVANLYNSAKVTYSQTPSRTASSTAGSLIGHWTMDASSFIYRDVLIDGDMEAGDTSAWTAVSNPTVSKETGARTGGNGSQVIRIAYTDTSNPYIYENRSLSTFGPVRVSGWARGDGTRVPRIQDGGTVLWTGTSSNTWQQFEITRRFAGNTLILACSTCTSAGYVEYDDVMASGYYAQDNSGFGNRGTFAGFHSSAPPTSTPGKINQAIDFDGSNGYVDAGDLEISNGITISAWVKADSLSHTGGGIAPRIIDKSGSYVMYVTNDGVVVFTIAGAADTSSASADNEVLPNKWYLLSATYDNITGTRLIYKNGVEIDRETTSGNIATSAYNLRFGNSAQIETRFWDGAIDDVRIYDYAMSAQEVAGLYNSAKSNYSRSFPRAGLVGYWNMDSADTSATKVHDKSGKGNHGTPAGFYTGLAPTSTPGKINQAVDFDGSNGYIQTSALGYASNNLAVGAWFKIDSTTGDKMIFHTATGASDRTGMVVDDNVLKCGNWNGSVYKTASANSPIKVGVWYHAYCHWISEVPTLYVNGVLQTGTTTYGSLGSQIRTTIGVRDLTLHFFNGAIDEVMIYDRALSAEEIQDLYLYRLQYMQ